MSHQPALAVKGRSRERDILDRLLVDARGGESAVLVLRGDAGMGKTTLLRTCVERASGFRVFEVACVESEFQLPLAAIHQLCAPMLEHAAALPEPQQRALRIAFGMSEGNAPERFVLALAVLGLLAEAADSQPLLCVVDDAQWLDAASSQVLAFVGRRLRAESIALLFAVREPAAQDLLDGLPVLELDGLPRDDALELLSASIQGHIDVRVRDRIIEETRGNPLALLELPARMSHAELAGFAVPDTADMTGRIQDHYVQRILDLPETTRRLMLLAAADPIGETTVFWRAAQALNLTPEAAAPAAEQRLLEVGSQVRFQHPLIRAAAYAVGTPAERSATHAALAAATDPELDPERRVWHRAAATSGPDEEVARELERAAERVEGRAGLAAAAVFLQRSAALTADQAVRTNRALAAANATLHAGDFDAAGALLADAEACAVDDLQRARVEQLRGQFEWATNPGGAAPGLLLGTANRLLTLDARLAHDMHLDAWVASWIAGPLAAPGGHLAEVSDAAQSGLAGMEPTEPGDLLLTGMAALVTDGRAAAEPSLRRALDAFAGDDVSRSAWLRWGALVPVAAMALWDFEGWLALSARHVEIARASGALAPLSIALNGLGSAITWTGEFDAAATLIAEEEAVKDVIGVHLLSTGSTLLAAYHGRPDEATQLFSASAAGRAARGEGLALQLVSWTTSILHNGLGHYEDALVAAKAATEEGQGPIFTPWVLPELVEAAARTGDHALADDAIRRLSKETIHGSDWATGLEARSRALVSNGDKAEELYAGAIEHLSRTRLLPELARAHLLFGEWLRRERRRMEAREHLRTAHEAFTRMGAEAFADRARRELLATGEKVRRRQVDTLQVLTPQEAHIARLARDGRTNGEIGGELFISARTVEWHLSHVFLKLGITSRRELRNALPVRGGAGPFDRPRIGVR